MDLLQGPTVLIFWNHLYSLYVLYVSYTSVVFAYTIVKKNFLADTYQVEAENERFNTTNRGTVQASSYVFIDSHGTYWLGTPDGLLFSYDEEAGLINRFKLVHTQSNWVYDLIEDAQGDIWASIAQGGLYKINVNGGRPGNFQADSGLGDDSYWATLLASDGKVWIGTRGGIDVYDPENKTLKHIGTKQGLIHETNSNLFEDKKGRIWSSGSNVGLSIIDLNNGTIKKVSSKEIKIN